MFAEQVLCVRPGDAAAQLGDARHLVQGVQLIETAQVQRDHGVELPAGGVQPAGHVGAAAERDDGDAVIGAVAQDLGDRVLTIGATGQQDRVGRILDPSVLPAQQVGG